MHVHRPSQIGEHHIEVRAKRPPVAEVSSGKHRECAETGERSDSLFHEQLHRTPTTMFDMTRATNKMWTFLRHRGTARCHFMSSLYPSLPLIFLSARDGTDGWMDSHPAPGDERVPAPKACQRVLHTHALTGPSSCIFCSHRDDAALTFIQSNVPKCKGQYVVISNLPNPSFQLPTTRSILVSG